MLHSDFSGPSGLSGATGNGIPYSKKQLNVLQLIVLRSDVRGVVVPEGRYTAGMKGMGRHHHLPSEDIKDTAGHEQITSTHTWGNGNSSASKYFYPQGSPNELTPVKLVSMQGYMVIKTERETGREYFNK